jgi:hypothetical protein
MCYPIIKFLDGCGQWCHINTVFNEPLKGEIAWCKIRRTGWPKEKFVVSIFSTSDPALRKNTIEQHSYISVKMVGSPVQLQNVTVIIDISWGNDQFSNMPRNESAVTVA